MMISATKVTVERIRPTDKMVSGKMKCSSLRGSSGSSSSSSSLNRNSFISKPAWNEVCQVVRLLDIFYLLEPHHMNIELLLEHPLLIDHGWAKAGAYLLLILAAIPLPHFKIRSSWTGTGLNDCGAISHYPSLNQILKLNPWLQLKFNNNSFWNKNWQTLVAYVFSASARVSGKGDSLNVWTIDSPFGTSMILMPLSIISSAVSMGFS